MTTCATACLTMVLFSAAMPGPAAAADSQMLWQIGQADGNNTEFALAPHGYGDYKSDGFFVVGQSDPKQDWPYVQPGQADMWAGTRTHTFTILFTLKAQPPGGDCQLRLLLLDVQNQSPPTIEIQVNGRSFEQALPGGNGDESIDGQPLKGRPTTAGINFASDLLHAGDNEIQIKTKSGSWFLYDAVQFSAPAGTELAASGTRTVIAGVETVRGLKDKDGKFFNPVNIRLQHFGGATHRQIQIDDGERLALDLTNGERQIEYLLPETDTTSVRSVKLEDEQGAVIDTKPVTVKPVPHLTVYILPHSHNDIGYTEIQTAVEKKQMNNLALGIQAAIDTETNPPGARFIWNLEVLWSADLYLQRKPEEQKNQFVDLVRNGGVALNGSYLNELTGLCRPEELLRLFRKGTELSQLTGVPVDSAMISDVPGYTWGTVPAMAQAGIKYFSAAPNFFDRIGTILYAWENKPFYWVGPDGHSKVLVCVPFWGYALSHRYGQLSPQLIDDLCDELKQRDYPYDIGYIRWSGHGDNAAPDPVICDAVKDWNAKYAWPKFIISGTSAAFQALEQKYGDKIPRVRGDFTPYWEDGAGSSALETGMSRANSDRLTQAETLYAMLKPDSYPTDDFAAAWRNVLLYSEHTWGADCSISQPESQKTKEQWEIKKGYVVHANEQSRTLVQSALAPSANTTAAQTGEIDLYNTLSWPRTELATLTAEQSAAGDRIVDADDNAVPSQRLSTGELVFCASNIPPFAAKRFKVTAGAAINDLTPAVASGNTLDNGLVHITVDEKTGGIVELTEKGIDGNFVDTSGGESLNDYRYLPGSDLADLKGNGPVTIRAGEKGPLVASLIIESAAPGCKSLHREIRIVAGEDQIELDDLVDKARIPGDDYHAIASKESVNFAFPFDIPDGQMLLDIPFAVMNPETDQIPGACKNWFTVGRWVDISNNDRGVTWVTMDAPLIEVGGITANLLNSQTNPEVWRKKVDRTQKFYSWAMNNHWGTNYRAYQEGQTHFRYILRPHRGTSPAENTRFATGFSYPLIATPAQGVAPKSAPLLQIGSPNVVAVSLKPSDDGKACIVRLFNCAATDTTTTVDWPDVKPHSVWLSNTAETPVSEIANSVSLPAWGLVTLRAELK